MSSTASVRTGPVSASPAGTGVTAPWRDVPRCAATTASAGQTSTGPGAASVRPAGTGRTAPPGWRPPAVTARTMTEVSSFEQLEVFYFSAISVSLHFDAGNLAGYLVPCIRGLIGFTGEIWHNYVDVDVGNSKISRVRLVTSNAPLGYLDLI